MTESRKPINPNLVLISAIVLPGSGQVINGQPFRGLIFLFFLLLLAGFTYVTAAEGASMAGRFAGGIFVWGMAVFDAYKRARIRAEVWRYQNSRPV